MHSLIRTPGGQTPAFYRRVSTDRQDNSLEAQEAATLFYARTRKRSGASSIPYADLPFLLPEGVQPLWFSDPDTSGRTVPLLQREGGRALFDRIKRGDIGHLIVTKVDRIARNAEDLLAIARLLTEQGVVLHIVSFGGDSLSTGGYFGKFLLTILAGMAEFEGSQIADNTKKSLAVLRERGQLTGKIPYGWDCTYVFADGTTLHRGVVLMEDELAALVTRHGHVLCKDMTVNHPEQARILEMARLRWPSWPDKIRRGMSLVRIARHLNSLGVPPKTPAGTLLDLGNGRTAITSGEWSIGSVGGILSSPQVETLRMTAIRNLSPGDAT